MPRKTRTQKSKEEQNQDVAATATTTPADEPTADTATGIAETIPVATATEDVPETPPVADEEQDQVPDGICQTCRVNPTEGKHRHCPVCFAKWREEQESRRATPTMVPCGSCSEETTQHVYPNGETAKVSFCYNCRQRRREVQGTAPKKRPAAASAVRKDPKEQALELRAALIALHAELGILSKDAEVSVVNLQQEGESRFSALRYPEAISSFEAGLAILVARQNAVTMAKVDIPAALEELRELTRGHMVGRLGHTFREKIAEAEIHANPQDLERFLAAPNPKDGERWVELRLDKIELILDSIPEMLENEAALEAETPEVSVDEMMPKLEEVVRRSRIHRAPTHQERQAEREKRRTPAGQRARSQQDAIVASMAGGSEEDDN